MSVECGHTPPLEAHYDATSLRHLPGKHNQKDHAGKHAAQPSSRIQLANGQAVALVDAKEHSPEEFARSNSATVDPDEAEEVKLYSDPNIGLLMNGYLRGYYDSPPEDEEILRERIHKLQGAINHNAVATDAMAFRRTRPDAFGIDPDSSPEQIGEQLHGLVGNTWADKGFLSTSVIHQTDGSLHYTDYPVEVQMRLPAGTKGIYMDRDELTHFPVEREFLLPAGTEHAIVGVRQEGKTWVVETQVVNQSPVPPLPGRHSSDILLPGTRAAKTPAPEGKKPEKSMLQVDTPHFEKVQKFKWLPDEEKAAN